MQNYLHEFEPAGGEHYHITKTRFDKEAKANSEMAFPKLTESQFTLLLHLQ